MPTRTTVKLSLVDRPKVPDRETLDQASLVELAESIRDRGCLSTPGVRRCGDRFEIVYGDRRTAAYRVLGWNEATFDVYEESEAAVEELRWTENGHREALKPLEEARAFKRMQDKGKLSVTQLALNVRKSVNVVRSRLALLDFPLDLQQAIQGERIAPSVAAPLAEVEDPDERRRLLEYAVSNGASAVVTRYWADQWNASRAMVDVMAAPPPNGNNGGAPVNPMYPCATCSKPTDLLELRVLHVCPECIKTIFTAGADAR